MNQDEIFVTAVKNEWPKNRDTFDLPGRVTASCSCFGVGVGGDPSRRIETRLGTCKGWKASRTHFANRVETHRI